MTGFAAECGGVTHSYFRANLDGATQDIATVPVKGGVVEDVGPVVPLPHAVSEANPEQWFLAVATKTCDCYYVPYFDYTSDGVTARFEIRLGDRPWEVSAAGAGSHLVYQDGDDGHWTTSK